MIKVGVVGASGYSGIELIRLLSDHPQVEITQLTSRQHVGTKLSEHIPSLVSSDLVFSELNQDSLTKCDLLFFATPHTIAMQYVPNLLDKGVKIIDLSADFRIQDIAIWEKFYQTKHICPDLVPQAIYGLAELNHEKIAHAQLIANPGCYPTASQLGLWPLLDKNLVDLDRIIIDAKSGVSGAGRELRVSSHYCQANENINAYGIGTHRHTPEILQGLESMADHKKIDLLFTPHLVPMNRGIHATIYSSLHTNKHDIHALYTDFYKHKPFVHILPLGASAHTADVKGSNYCFISVSQINNKIIVCAVIDNLIKGASGLAMQNMNLMFGFDETLGLLHTPLTP